MQNPWLAKSVKQCAIGGWMQLKSFIGVYTTILPESIPGVNILAGMVDLGRSIFKDKTQSSKGQNHNLHD